MFPLGLPSHSLYSHLFGCHPPVSQAVSLQLAVVPDCHMVSQPLSCTPFMLSSPGSSCEAWFLACLQAGSFTSSLLHWLLLCPAISETVSRSKAPWGGGMSQLHHVPPHKSHTPWGLGTLPTAQVRQQSCFSNRQVKSLGPYLQFFSH